MLLCFACWGLARAEIVEIGDDTTAGNNTPIGTYYNYSFTEQLYLADEIGMAGTINSIGFDYAFSDAKSFPIDVYMKTVDATDLSSSISIEDDNLVFSGTLYVSGPGWATIELDTPFDYDGTSNLLIAINKYHVSYFTGNTWYYTNVSNMARYVQRDSNGYTPTNSLPSMTATSNRPNVQLDITPAGGSYCSRPTGLAVALTPGNGTIANLNWTENGEASLWQICLNDDESNLIEVSENPYTLTELTAETSYTAKVRANCGSSQSAWSNTISFTPTEVFQLTVNDGTVTNQYVPVYGYWCDKYSKSQFIIPAESLQNVALGTIITKLTFYSSNGSVSWGSAQFSVYLSEVSETQFSSASLYSWDEMDEVYAGSLSIVDNQMVVELENGYTYNGNNLLVGIREITSGSYSSSNWYGVSSTGSAIGGYENSRTLAVYDFLPKTTFDFIPSGGNYCPKPKNLVCETYTANTATFTWINGGNETQWQLEYCTNEDFIDAISIEVYQGDIINGAYTLTGLTPETRYYVRVKAYCPTCEENGGYSQPSNTVVFKTLETCPTPTALTTSNVQSTSATIDWSGDADNYYLRYKPIDDPTTATIILTAGDVWDDGSGYQMLLDADATAYGTIIPTSGGLTSEGDASDEVYAEFEYKIPVNADGSCETLNTVMNNSISIRIPAGTYDWCITNPTPGDRIWISSDSGNVGGRANDYIFEAGKTYEFTVTLGADHHDQVDVIISGGAKNRDDEWIVVEDVTSPYTLSGLTPETWYEVEVQAVCEDDESAWAGSTFFTHELCPVPTNLQATVSLESVVVTWVPGNEQQSEWELQYKMVNENDWTLVENLTEPMCTITGLANATDYEVQVRAVCIVNSLWTPTITFTSAQIYVFNTYVDEEVYPMNTTIPIHGTVTSNLINAPIANLDVEIGITVMGWRRTLATITDENGHFTATFEPMPLESGYYTVNSGMVGSNSAEVHDSFDIIGMNVMEYTLNEGMGIENSQWLLCNVIQNIPKTGHIQIRNNNSFALTNVQVTVLSAPQGASFTFVPTTVAGLTEGYIEYSALGTIPTPGYEYQEVRLKATSDQGAEAIFTMWFYCEEARGILDVSPSAINTTMTRGLSKTIDVTLSNNGQAATGEITISLPNEEWMSVVGGTTMSSIEVGETVTFTLRLSPDNTVPLAQFSGTIVVNCEHGESVTLPYSILAVSEENGALLVDVTDEFTTNTNGGNGPHVEGAEITLTSYYSHEVIAHGFTADDGTFSVEDIPEGYYTLNVQASAHTGYEGNILIEAGVTKQMNVFLQYQCVSYSWHVEPTEITDEYLITLDVEFEVEVPVPVITVQAPHCISGFGDSYTFNYIITNHGLIDAYNLALYVPEDEYYLFTPLYDYIDTIHGHTSVEIPCVVTRKSSMDPSCGNWGQSRVQYSYLSGQDMMYNGTIGYTLLGSCTTFCHSLPSLDGGYGGSGYGGGSGAPIFGGGGSGGSGGGNYTTPLIENQLPTVDVIVGVQFSQRLTMTREAFIGTFAVHNEHDTNAVTGIGLNFVIKNEQGVDCTNLFQIAVQSMDGVTGIDGNGTLTARSDGLVKILFIPTKDAAPTEPIMYSFGGTFTFVDPLNGVTRVMDLYPTELEVHPSPDLYIDYFVQEDVYGDNPLTPEIEPIIPAELAVRIWNKGVGMAKNVILETAKPVIVQNTQNLLIEFGLYGAYIEGEGVQIGLDSINFGNIESGETKVGEWLFTSSLLAHVVSYNAHVVHNNSYGNPKLSLVSHVGIHRLTHAIHTFGSRSDAINDFLVDDILDENNYPDSIFFSDGGRTSVGVAESISFDKFVTSHDTIVTLTVNPSRIGWNYGETEDPGRNHYKLLSCTRNNDGQNIPLSNVWQESIILHETGDSLYANKLRFVDTLSMIQPVTYTLVFAGNPSDPYIFFGDEDEYWSNAANWEGNAKPQSVDNNVLIDGICKLDEDVTVSSLTVSEGKSLTIPEDRILTVSGDLTNTVVTGLVIEDGGQLMHNNIGVQAIVQKIVTPYTPGTKDGWHLVAHPIVSNVDIPTVENMMSNEYDLYYYDEPTVYWINQEDATNNFTELENGKGYLYGNNQEVTLEFAGELQNGSAMVEVPLSYTAGPRLAGFNLVGNPYAHNVTSYTSENVVNGCFVMNEAKDDLVVSEINEENPLQPAEGFFVKAMEENASITFNPQRVDMTSSRGTIRVELTENDKIVDRLIVKTAEGQPLEKFSLNEMRTKLFAQGDSQELAIVPCQSNEQPVSFKASRNGQYTVAVNTDGMEFKYLHLVDNLTGEDVDLLSNPNYTFEAHRNDYTSRFLLRFILSEDNAFETGNFVYFFNDKMVIANEGKATLQVIDLLGRILSSEQINGSCEKQISVPSGVYMIRLINGDDMKVQKVLVK